MFYRLRKIQFFTGLFLQFIRQYRNIYLFGLALAATCLNISYSAQSEKWIDAVGMPHFLVLPDNSPTMPTSEISYPGASAGGAFRAIEPYRINVMGVTTVSRLLGKPRTHNFSGNVPFINSVSGASDAAVIQGWDPTANSSII